MAAKPKILIADDQPDVQRAISFICAAEGYQPITASSPAAALKQLAEGSFDLLLMDMNYRADHTSGEEGLRLIQEVRQLRPDLPVVVMTAWGSIALAVEALKLGAKDFLQKPWDNERLIQILRTQLELRSALQGKAKLEAENQAWRDAAKTQPEPLVSLSPSMREVYRMVEQVAPADANVLITGENGTGKNVVARLIHERSTRSARPLISVNMGGIPENLFESEMFGHVKGAFTDARADRVGRFELADGGSLFLDEIGNLTSSQQSKILRVLETGEFERVGSSRTQKVDTRILSATNADLQRDIQNGRFREDLFFRLNTIEIHLPPLRERKEDLPSLVDLFLTELSQRYRKPALKVGPDAMRAMQEYHWPGNLRELRHVIERAVLLARADFLEAGDLGIMQTGGRGTTIEELDLEGVEAHLIKKALSRFSGNANQAAEALGLSRSAFYRRMQKYGIKAREG